MIDHASNFMTSKKDKEGHITTIDSRRLVHRAGRSPCARSTSETSASGSPGNYLDGVFMIDHDVSISSNLQMFRICFLFFIMFLSFFYIILFFGNEILDHIFSQFGSYIPFTV